MTTRTGTENGPKYDQIYQLIRQRITSGQLTAGDYLSAENQLAEEFGVSVGTIKKALGKLVEDGLIRRCRGRGTQVVEPAEGTGGPALRKQSVLVLLGEVKRSFFAEIYSGIQSELKKHDLQPVLHDNSDSAEVERQLLEDYAGAVEGAIVAPFSGTANYPGYARLLALETPLVFVDRYLPRLNVDAVVSDNRNGGYLATRHLLELGHRRIAAIGRLHAVSMRDRLNGYRRALAEFDQPFDERLVFTPRDGGFDGAYALTGTLRDEYPDVTAVFGMRDDAAWGCLQRLLDLGVNVPGQMSVVGFGDDADLCGRLRPRLTTVRQGRQEMGVAAARLLLTRLRPSGTGRAGATSQLGDLLNEEELNPRLVSLAVELVVRESTARVRREAASQAGGSRPAPGTSA